SAQKGGAGRVGGVELDPQAVERARLNGARNRAPVEYSLPDDAPDGQFDVVVANILSNPLKLMGSMLSSRGRAGGTLALSGVLARQADEVAAAYAPWLALSVWREHEGWVCLTGTAAK